MQQAALSLVSSPHRGGVCKSNMAFAVRAEPLHSMNCLKASRLLAQFMYRKVCKHRSRFRRGDSSSRVPESVTWHVTTHLLCPYLLITVFHMSRPTLGRCRRAPRCALPRWRPPRCPPQAPRRRTPLWRSLASFLAVCWRQRASAPLLAPTPRLWARWRLAPRRACPRSSPAGSRGQRMIASTSAMSVRQDTFNFSVNAYPKLLAADGAHRTVRAHRGRPQVPARRWRVERCIINSFSLSPYVSTSTWCYPSDHLAADGARRTVRAYRNKYQRNIAASGKRVATSEQPSQLSKDRVQALCQLKAGR